jgi:prepilin-type N-terminal cleavage/methylation domain-containing protein
MNNTLNIQDDKNGFSIVELVIVVLIISILALIALPQLNATRRLMKFAGLQRQVVGTLRDARQQAISERSAITVRYTDSTKQILVYGGKFGVVGAAENLSVSLPGEGIPDADIIYGKPPTASLSALADGSNEEALNLGVWEFSFQGDGTVVDAGNNPINKAIFIYDLAYPDSAFAVSILGAGGRVKVWRYSAGVNGYVE